MAQENREAYIAWLREKLEDYCNDDGSYEVYWDYDDSITPDQLVEAVDNWKSEGYTSPESYLASTLYEIQSGRLRRASCTSPSSTTSTTRPMR